MGQAAVARHTAGLAHSYPIAHHRGAGIGRGRLHPTAGLAYSYPIAHHGGLKSSEVNDIGGMRMWCARQIHLSYNTPYHTALETCYVGFWASFILPLQVVDAKAQQYRFRSPKVNW